MRSLKELEKVNRLKIEGIMIINNVETVHGIIRLKGRRFHVIFSDREGRYEHVSVSALNPKVLPTWEQMCELKDIFFYPEELVVQIHPKASEYVHGVGDLKNILHLWRAIDDRWEILREGK